MTNTTLFLLQGPLSRAQMETFFEDGYLFLPDFYNADALSKCRSDTEGMIDKLATRLHNAGKINSLYKDHDWTSRLLRMREEFSDAPVVLIKGGVLPKAFQTMFSDERILDIAEQLGAGPELALNPAWNLRGKMPAHEETVVPWHQDNSYWEPRIWDEVVLTVWVALVDATPENGCMQMVRGAHKSGMYYLETDFQPSCIMSLTSAVVLMLQLMEPRKDRLTHHWHHNKHLVYGAERANCSERATWQGNSSRE